MKAKNFLDLLRKSTFLTLGAVIYAIALQIFLIPNKMIDGGVNGISIIVSYLLDAPVGLFIVGLNIPFLFIGYKQIGKTFMFSSLYSVVMIAVFVTLFAQIEPFRDDNLFLVAIFGGIILGVGNGIIVRYGGLTDGIEVVAIIIDRKTDFTIGEIIMFVNIFVMSSAGFVFGWDRALYSFIVYFIATRLIDVTIRGLDVSRAIFIVSDKAEIIAEALMLRLGRSVTFLSGTGGYSKEPKKVIYLVITRLEIAKFKKIIIEIDPAAFVTITEVQAILGSFFKKKDIH